MSVTDNYLTLKITARESKTREIWQSDGPTKFFGSCYDVSHEKKTCDTKIPSFGGDQIMVQVAYSSIKNSKIRFEFRRLLDRLGVYERCQITQRERETISLRPAAPPRVNLVLKCGHCRSDSLNTYGSSSGISIFSTGFGGSVQCFF